MVDNSSTYLDWYLRQQRGVVSLYLYIAATKVDLDDINILLGCDIFQALPSQDILVDGEMVHELLKLSSGDVAGQLPRYPGTRIGGVVKLHLTGNHHQAVLPLGNIKINRQGRYKVVSYELKGRQIKFSVSISGMHVCVVY